jgi:syntaxin 1B/2/3
MEVHELFQEIAILVASQGDMVNNIAANVFEAEVKFEEGVKILGEAKKFRDKSRKKKLCLYSVLGVIIVIIVVVLLIQFGV